MVSSSKWAIINQIVTQGIRLGVSVYLMRLLEPESFGIFMKVLAITGISEILIGLRLGGGIVQQKKVNEEDLSTVFWLNTVWAIVLALIFYSISSHVGAFYNDVRVTELMQLSSIVIALISLGYVPRSVLTKKLHYKKIFIANAIAVSVSSYIGVYLALQGLDYWSLFWLWASYNLVLSIAYFMLSGYKPKLIWQPGMIINMWIFSRKILLNDLLNYTARNVDNIVVGRVLGGAALGIYSRAYNIMLIPIQNFVNVLNGVLFPSFSIIQDDKNRIREIFSKAVSSTLLLTIPFMLYGWMFADELTIVAFGEKWQELGPLLQIFLILGMIQVQTVLAGSVFMALGRSDLPLKVSYVSKPILIISILLLVNYGTEFLAIGIMAISGLFSFIQLALALRLLQFNFVDFIKRIAPIWSLNLLILCIFYLSRGIWAENYTLLMLAINLGIVVLGNLVFFEKVKPAFYLELKSILVQQFRST